MACVMLVLPLSLALGSEGGHVPNFLASAVRAKITILPSPELAGVQVWYCQRPDPNRQVEV